MVRDDCWTATPRKRTAPGSAQSARETFLRCREKRRRNTAARREHFLDRRLPTRNQAECSPRRDRLLVRQSRDALDAKKDRRDRRSSDRRWSTSASRSSRGVDCSGTAHSLESSAGHTTASDRQSSPARARRKQGTRQVRRRLRLRQRTIANRSRLEGVAHGSGDDCLALGAILVRARPPVDIAFD